MSIISVLNENVDCSLNSYLIRPCQRTFMAWAPNVKAPNRQVSRIEDQNKPPLELPPHSSLFQCMHQKWMVTHTPPPHYSSHSLYSWPSGESDLQNRAKEVVDSCWAITANQTIDLIYLSVEESVLCGKDQF